MIYTSHNSNHDSAENIYDIIEAYNIYSVYNISDIFFIDDSVDTSFILVLSLTTLLFVSDNCGVDLTFESISL